MIGAGLVAQSDPRLSPDFTELRSALFLLRVDSMNSISPWIPAVAIAAAFGCGGRDAGTNAGTGAATGGSPGSTSTIGTSDSGASDAACSSNSLLSGASYNIAKSRFAFGSMPLAQDVGRFVRWVGSDGVVAIWSDGSVLGIMNGGASESDLPDWSMDSSKLAAHTIDYWLSMGVASCQIANKGILGSGSIGGSINGGSTVTTSSRTIALSRGINGVPVVESLAVARFNVNDQTTQETFYWPEIPADVVSMAVVWNNQLADPNALASYKAKLPADAQGEGRVVIHHTTAGSSSAFQTAATYDVLQTAPPPANDGGLIAFQAAELSCDQNGNRVTTVW